MSKNLVVRGASFRAEKLKEANDAAKVKENEVDSTNDLICSINNLNTSFKDAQNDTHNAFLNLINKINNSLISGQRINSESVVNSTKDLNISLESVQKEISLLSYNINSLKNIKNEFTSIINKKNLTAYNGYDILNLEGCGKLRDLTVSLTVKPEIYIKVNNNEVYNIHASFDDLVALSAYSENITAVQDGVNYIVNLVDIKFTDTIVASLYFNGQATINYIYCIYDLRE